jgi:hypothetical protein
MEVRAFATEISASSPWTLITILLGTIGTMATYVLRLSGDRVSREKEISTEYQRQRDAAIAALDAERQQREDKLLSTMEEVIRASSAIETNVARIARATFQREKPPRKADV